MTEPTVTDEQRAQADETHGIVVKRIETGEVLVVERHELLGPAQAQTVLYVPPAPEPNEEQPEA